jgi:hypothetical protein
MCVRPLQPASFCNLGHQFDIREFIFIENPNMNIDLYFCTTFTEVTEEYHETIANQVAE